MSMLVARVFFIIGSVLLSLRRDFSRRTLGSEGRPHYFDERVSAKP